MKNKAKVGVLALGRTTFDVPYAQEMLAQAWQTLSGMDIELVGEPVLQFDAESALQILPALKQANLESAADPASDLYRCLPYHRSGA